MPKTNKRGLKKTKTRKNRKGGMFRKYRQPYEQNQYQYNQNQQNQYGDYQQYPQNQYNQQYNEQYNQYPQNQNQYNQYPQNQNQYNQNQYPQNQECNTNAVAMDCEMVSIGLDSNKKHILALAHIAIVNFNGEEIYNKYVIPEGGIKEIHDYLTKYSGITPNILKNIQYDRTHYFDNVREEVIGILYGKTIVGHGLDSDFKALKLDPEYYIWDTAKIPEYQKMNPYGKLQAKKLKELYKEMTGNNIQLNTGTGHSPLEDARASMNLYRLACGSQKVYYNNMSSSY